MHLFRRFRDAVVCIVLLALPFFVLRANLTDPSRVNAVDRTILELSAPIQYGTSQLAQGLSAILQEYVYLVEVKRDNDRLERRLAQAEIIIDVQKKLSVLGIPLKTPNSDGSDE